MSLALIMGVATIIRTGIARVAGSVQMAWLSQHYHGEAVHELVTSAAHFEDLLAPSAFERAALSIQHKFRHLL